MGERQDVETLRFAARVLREVADILEGDEEPGQFVERWQEYERVRRTAELRRINGGLLDGAVD